VLFRMLSSMSQVGCLLCSGTRWAGLQLCHVVYLHSHAVCCVAPLWMPSSGRFATVFNGFYQLISVLLNQDILWFRGHQPAGSHILLRRNNKALDTYCAASQVTWAASSPPPVRYLSLSCKTSSMPRTWGYLRCHPCRVFCLLDLDGL
jgi:hypothetical protein